MTAFNTGTVLTGPKVLIDAKDPRTPESEKVERWVPALAYLVRHPREGAFLLDTGVPAASADGRCDFGHRPFFWFKCRGRAGQDIASQLRREGLPPKRLRFAAISHLHGDHAGGLPGLVAAGLTRVAVTPLEWAAAKRPSRLVDGYIASQLRVPYELSLLPMERAVEMPIVGRALDLFGDGSVFILPTTGHTRGSFSVLLNAVERPILLTFDASHLRAGLEHGVAPGFARDRPAAQSAVARLRALVAAFPRIRVLYGHEPSDWEGQPIRVPLAGR